MSQNRIVEQVLDVLATYISELYELFVFINSLHFCVV